MLVELLDKKLTKKVKELTKEELIEKYNKLKTPIDNSPADKKIQRRIMNIFENEMKKREIFFVKEV